MTAGCPVKGNARTRATQEELCARRLLRSRRDIHLDSAPFALIEPQNAQQAPCRVPDQNCNPDMKGLKRPGLLDHEADSKRNDDLGDYRDVERTLCVSGALQSSRVGECDGDKQARQAEDAEKLRTDLYYSRFVHAENREELPREEKKE